MKKLIVLMMLVLPMMAVAQKIYKNEVDKFTGKRVVETRMEVIAKFNKWKSLSAENTTLKVAVRNAGDKWYLVASIVLDQCEKFGEGDGVTLLLSNNETIFLPSLYTGISEPSKAPGSHLWTFNTVFNLTLEQVHLLNTYVVTDIRISSLEHNYDLSIPEKSQDKLMKMILLVEKEL